MSYLVVVAHPDDEVLGAGATIYKLTELGIEVNVCIVSGEAEARRNKPGKEKFNEHLNCSMEVLGVKKVILGDFPNIELNTVSHLELVQFIENAIVETDAHKIITHFPADLNNDHLQTSQACMAAARLFQRRDDIISLKELFFMEVPSATEWGLNGAMKMFNPNTFFEVGEEGINKKIEALKCYKGVMREFPHPRSSESIKGLAAYRGGQSGMNYAEAFQSVFRRGF